MRALFLFPLLALLGGCTVTMPLGDQGQYGEVFAGYRPPVRTLLLREDILDTPTLRDK